MGASQLDCGQVSLGMKNLPSYPVIAPNALLGARHTTTEQLLNTRTPMGASAPVLTIVT